MALSFYLPLQPPFHYGKLAAGTEAVYGLKARSRAEAGTKVYGLAGEAMLNFGVIGVPIAFTAFAVILGYYRKKLLTMTDGDARLLIAPLLTLLAVSAIGGDTENIVFSLIKKPGR